MKKSDNRKGKRSISSHHSFNLFNLKDPNLLILQNMVQSLLTEQSQQRRKKNGNMEITFIILAYIPLELQTSSFSSRQSLLFGSVCQCSLAFQGYRGHIQASVVLIAWSFHPSGSRHRAGGPQKLSNLETGPSPSVWRTGPSSDPQSGPHGCSSHNWASPTCGMPTKGHSSLQTRATLQYKWEKINKDLWVSV